jgi:hypothetical protein
VCESACLKIIYESAQQLRAKIGGIVNSIVVLSLKCADCWHCRQKDCPAADRNKFYVGSVKQSENKTVTQYHSYIKV